MSGDLKKRKNKRTIVIEDLDNGAVRVTVAGPPYIVAGVDGEQNLSTCDIAECWLMRFTPGDGEDRATYAAKWCTWCTVMHGTDCDGGCHEVNCDAPADFFVCWVGCDGEERRIPSCRWHSCDTIYRLGRAVFWALNYGVTEDLRFRRNEDRLPGGVPRCDGQFGAYDQSGDFEDARCTLPATKRVKISGARGREPEYEAKFCADCLARPVPSGGTLEVLGDIELPPAEHTLSALIESGLIGTLYFEVGMLEHELQLVGVDIGDPARARLKAISEAVSVAWAACEREKDPAPELE